MIFFSFDWVLPAKSFELLGSSPLFVFFYLLMHYSVVILWWLWPPLCNRAGRYFLPCGFFFYLLSSSFYPRLISAIADWMSTILPHMVWPYCKFKMQVWNVLHALAANTGRKKVAKNRHLGTIPQLCRAISLQLRHVSTIGKNLLSSNISSTWPHNDERRSTSG